MIQTFTTPGPDKEIASDNANVRLLNPVNIAQKLGLNL
jgi:hypothetical protein